MAAGRMWILRWVVKSHVRMAEIGRPHAPVFVVVRVKVANCNSTTPWPGKKFALDGQVSTACGRAGEQDCIRVASLCKGC